MVYDAQIHHVSYAPRKTIIRGTRYGTETITLRTCTIFVKKQKQLTVSFINKMIFLIKNTIHIRFP